MLDKLKKSFIVLELASGRTAIDLAVKNISYLCGGFFTVLLPNFICDSMVEPFIKNNIKYDFYNIQIINGRLVPEIIKCNKDDCILICDYFFYSEGFHKQIKQLFKFTYTIHDITFSLFDKKLEIENSDFIVASVRKWTRSIDGGIFASSYKNQFKLRGENKKYLIDKEQENLRNIDADKTLMSDFELYSISLLGSERIRKFNILPREKILNEIKDFVPRELLFENFDYDNCLLTFPLNVGKKKDEISNLLKMNNIRHYSFWAYHKYNEQFTLEIIDTNICIDISEKTLYFLKKGELNIV